MWFSSIIPLLKRSAGRYQEVPLRHRKTRRNSAPLKRSFVPRLECLEDRTVLSTLTVTSPADDGSSGTLRAVIASAGPGDTIQFAKKLKGDTITLTQGQLTINKNLDIEGLGAKKLTISGNDAGRLFDIKGGVAVTLAGLTLTGGLADHGGAILNEAGASLTLSKDTLAQNQAVGGLGGGAIFNDAGANLSVTGSSLTQNQALTAVSFDPTTGGGGGGAVFNDTGATLSVTDSDLSGNQAITTVGFDNFGGGIYNLGGTATISGCTLSNNQVSDGGSFSLMAGSAGGALENQAGAKLMVTNSRFTSNQASCGAGNIEIGIFYFAEGGAIDNEVNSTATIRNSQFTKNRSVGGPGGGEGDGGAIVNDFAALGGTLSVADSSFTGNQALGGPDGGSTAGGAVYNTGLGSVAFTGCTFTGNRAVGGDGGVVNDLNPSLGLGEGGAIHNDVSMTLENCTFTGNQAIGGNGGSGGDGGAGFYAFDLGGGGAIFNHPQASAVLGIDGCTFTDNQAVGGSNGTGGINGQGNLGYGRGGALLNLGIATITNSTFDHNRALGGSGNTGNSRDVLVGTGDGGAIGNGGFFFAAVLTGSNLTLSHNQAVGGDGDTGSTLAGDGIGGGLSNVSEAIATVSSSTIDHNQAIGGQGAPGSNGGDGLGGGLANILGSTLTVSNCTVDHNQAVGGEGDDGGNGGNGLGGGIYNDGSTAFGVSSLTVTGTTITHNKAIGGEGEGGGSDGQGIGGGVYLAAGSIACKDASTVIAHNHASTSNDDLFGVFTTCP